MPSGYPVQATPKPARSEAVKAVVPSAPGNPRSSAQAEYLMHDAGPGQALERDLADRFERGDRLDRRDGTLAHQDLAVAGSVAEARGEIGDGAHGGVIDVVLEADPTQRGVALGDADAEADLMAALAPVH